MMHDQDRPVSKNVGQLRQLIPYVTQYKGHILLALLFLVLGAVTTLYLPVALKHVVDLGFSESQQDKISQYFWLMFAVSILMAVFTSLRYFWVSWIGQRLSLIHI